MVTSSVVLATNVSSVAAQPQQAFSGGRAVLSILAGTYPTTVTVQSMGPDNSTWLPINTSNITANGVYAYDVPTGPVRLFLSGGTAAGLYATLTKVPY